MIFANVSERDIIAKVRKAARGGEGRLRTLHPRRAGIQCHGCPPAAQDRLDALAQAHPNQFSIHYIVDKASSSSWKGRCVEEPEPGCVCVEYARCFGCN